jgi:hypothetical protein
MFSAGSATEALRQRVHGHSNGEFHESIIVVVQESVTEEGPHGLVIADAVVCAGWRGVVVNRATGSSGDPSYRLYLERFHRDNGKIHQLLPSLPERVTSVGFSTGRRSCIIHDGDGVVPDEAAVQLSQKHSQWCTGEWFYAR